MVESFLALISTIHKSPHPIGRSIVVLTAACISKSASRSPKDLPAAAAGPNSWSPYRGRGRLPHQSKK